ncbi:MAG: DUF72 domain-containing protein [Acidobacteriia bacterium]|nr:DUF72 domain-containing protein [Terriglobia bacterium]
MNAWPLYLGTSSWTAVGWETAFYPPHTKEADFLPFYATRFNSVEIDSTFYRIPTAKTVQQWRERTPEGFVFAAKLPQTITHEKVLVDAEGDLKAFLGVMDILGPKLGPLLIQMPYFNKQKFSGVDSFLQVLEPFLGSLPKRYQWAVEVRNRHWLSEKLFSVLRNHGVASTLIDHPWMPRPNEVFQLGDPITAGYTYVRWLGDRKGIEKRTLVWDRTIVDRTEELREWVRILKQLQKRNIRIYGFINNHYAGFAPETVRLFNELWAE